MGRCVVQEEPSSGYSGTALGSLEIKNRYDRRMQRFRRTIDTVISDELVLKHLIMDLETGKMPKQGSARQNMVKHFWAPVVQYSEASVAGQTALNRRQYATRQVP